MFGNNNTLSINKLAFEITRKCTQQCDHCMRGPMQNIDIDTKIIDAFFQQCEKYESVFIGELFFTGGEPLLNIDAINYILGKIKNLEGTVYVASFGIITNGMVYNEKCEKTLLELYNTVLDPLHSWIACSLDQFHIKPSEHNLKNLKKLPFFKETEERILKKSDILNYGLAKKNKLGCPKNVENAQRRPVRYIKEHIKDGTDYSILDDVLINSKGYVHYLEDCSYLFQDKYNLGNILLDNFIDLFEEAKIVKVRKKTIK